MRVPIAHYLMLIYVTLMFKPLTPVISDAISHTFSEARHLATVHSVSGSNHLEQELSHTAPDNTNSKHPNSIAAEEQVPLHVLTHAYMDDFCFNNTNKNYSSLKLHKPGAGFISKQSPPPKFAGKKF